jgi:lysozyme
VKTSEAGLQFLQQQEGSRKEMYRDFVGIPTIGVGHQLTKDECTSGKLAIAGEWVPWHTGLTEAQVLALLAQDVHTAEAALNADAPAVNPHQFDALVSFVFNVGAGAYGGSTLRKCLLLGDLAAVPAQLMRWVYAGGVVSPVLERRRTAECGLWNQVAVTV